jgi:hypothetical protein
LLTTRPSRSGAEGRCSWGRVAIIELITVQRIEHVGIVVEYLAAARSFFVGELAGSGF